MLDFAFNVVAEAKWTCAVLHRIERLLISQSSIDTYMELLLENNACFFSRYYAPNTVINLYEHVLKG